MKALLNILFPIHCLLCNRRLRNCVDNTLLCTTCKTRLRIIYESRCSLCFEPISRLYGSKLCAYCDVVRPTSLYRFIGHYRGTLRRAIKLIKFNKRKALLPFFATVLAPYLQPIASRWDTIVPVPTRFLSFYRRGFHQTLVLSHSLSTHLGDLPVQELLFQNQFTKRQTSLTASQRFKNIKHAFTASPEAIGKRILLVDDVMTTGATTEKAKSCLLLAGALSVDFVCIARSPSFHKAMERYNTDLLLENF